MSAGANVDAVRQAECLGHIANAIKSWNEAPTMSELGTRMGISKVSAHLLVKKLQADGLVTVGAGWRNLQITIAGHAVIAGALKGFHKAEALRERRAS